MIGFNDIKKLLDDFSSNIFELLSSYGSSVGAPLSVTLDTGKYGRTTLEVWVKSNNAADFNVYGSRDGVNWRLADTISLTAAGEQHKGYFNGYRYVKVETSAANNNEIEISAGR